LGHPLKKRNMKRLSSTGGRSRISCILEIKRDGAPGILCKGARERETEPGVPRGNRDRSRKRVGRL